MVCVQLTQCCLAEDNSPPVQEPMALVTLSPEGSFLTFDWMIRSAAGTTTVSSLCRCVLMCNLLCCAGARVLLIQAAADSTHMS